MIKIVTAYADLMNQYGEYAGVRLLCERLKAAGEQVTVESFSVGTKPSLEGCDLLCFFAGTEKSLLAAMADAKQHKNEISQYVKKGGNVLLTGNSMGIFANTVTDLKNKKHDGFGLLNCDLTIIPKRRYTEVIFQSADFAGETIGAINSSIVVKTAEKPLFKVVFDSTKTLGQYEGMVKDNIFATQLTGPMLMRNPVALDEMAAKLSKKELEKCEEKWYEYALLGYDNVLGILKKASGK